MFAVFGAGRDDIDSRRIDIAVPKDVGELGDVFFQTVEDSGKQMPQIVWEDLARIDVGLLTERLHFPPDVRPADRLASACNENTTGNDALLRTIAEQLFLQFLYQKHRAGLALAGDNGLSAVGRFYRDERQLAHADASTADRL